MSFPQNKDHTVFKRIVFALAVLFFIKASIVSIWIIRPWDVPDEVGHFSYIKDLATGEGIPVLHETFIDSDVWLEFCDYPVGANTNWIAQHPPLYPMLMVPVYWAGSLFGDSFWGAFHLIRIMSGLMFGAGLALLIFALREAGLGKGIALGCGIIMASVPTLTFMAAGVNHDSLVFLLGSCVLYYWVRYLKKSEPKDMVLFAVFIGLAMVTKYTMIVLAVPTVGFVLWRWVKSKNKEPRAFVLAGMFIVLPIGLWMWRNFSVMGELLPVDMSGFVSSEPLEVGLLGFFGEVPLFSNVYSSFWGLIGWLGDRNLELRWLHIQPAYLQPQTWPIVVFCLLGIAGLIRGSLKDSQKRMLICVGAGVSALVGFGIAGWFAMETRYLLPVYWAGLFLCAAGVADLLWLTVCNEGSEKEWVERTALSVAVCFVVIYSYKVYSISIPAGQLQASFGRYFFPVVGFFIIGLMGPLSRSFERVGILVLGCSLIYPLIEFYFWVQEVMPFFS